jgi:protein-S-isoprenylcysteine O-methyltransferase Ste14
MSNSYVRAVLANLVTLAILLGCLFIPAGTLDYWQAWLFVAVFEVSAQALGIYFLVHDRKLVERRMNIGPVAEQRPVQKLISALFILGFVGFVVLPAFDHRFGWSPLAPVVSVIANAMIVLSFLLFFAVMKSNSYAASTIQVEEKQPVVSSGPYAYVRHPMYLGALLLVAAMPLALGSWWGVLLVVPFFPVLVWRILDEEIFLRKNVSGYAEYMRQVRYRLVPRVVGHRRWKLTRVRSAKHSPGVLLR